MKLFLLLFGCYASALSGDVSTMGQILTKAARLGDLKTAEALLSSGVDPNLTDRYGRTPLYYAALFERNDMAALLLAQHADPNLRPNIGMRERETPQTPLQIAASMGNLRLASMLIAAGAHVDGKAEAGRTALHFAVVGDHLDLIRYLIQKGADVHARDAEGINPLDDAVWRGYLEATALLIAKGARLNEPETKTGATPINQAAYRGETEMVRYLLLFKPNLGLADKRGYAPLENSIRIGNEDSALLLLEAAPPEQKTAEFLNKMSGAAIMKDFSVLVEALLRCGVTANELLPSGHTLLDAAASERAEKVVRVLLNAGADPNRIGRDGASPLEEACLRGFRSIAEMLLDKGASVNEVNSGSGKTSLYAAAAFGKSDVVDLLLQRGADPAICGDGKVSPYNAALENGYVAIAAEIQKHGGSKGCKAASRKNPAP